MKINVSEPSTDMLGNVEWPPEPKKPISAIIVNGRGLHSVRVPWSCFVLDCVSWTTAICNRVAKAADLAAKAHDKQLEAELLAAKQDLGAWLDDASHVTTTYGMLALRQSMPWPIVHGSVYPSFCAYVRRMGKPVDPIDVQIVLQREKGQVCVYALPEYLAILHHHGLRCTSRIRERSDMATLVRAHTEAPSW